jgi:hypothetical protein
MRYDIDDKYVQNDLTAELVALGTNLINILSSDIGAQKIGLYQLDLNPGDLPRKSPGGAQYFYAARSNSSTTTQVYNSGTFTTIAHGPGSAAAVLPVSSESPLELKENDIVETHLTLMVNDTVVGDVDNMTDDLYNFRSLLTWEPVGGGSPTDVTLGLYSYSIQMRRPNTAGAGTGVDTKLLDVQNFRRWRQVDVFAFYVVPQDLEMTELKWQVQVTNSTYNSITIGRWSTNIIVHRR